MVEWTSILDRAVGRILVALKRFDSQHSLLYESTDNLFMSLKVLRPLGAVPLNELLKMIKVFVLISV